MTKTIINVVDATCGYGKTSWAIQYMNRMPEESRQFIYVTPFLDEVQRVKESVASRRFHDPVAINGETMKEKIHKNKMKGLLGAVINCSYFIS